MNLYCIDETYSPVVSCLHRKHELFLAVYLTSLAMVLSVSFDDASSLTYSSTFLMAVSKENEEVGAWPSSPIAFTTCSLTYSRTDRL